MSSDQSGAAAPTAAPTTQPSTDVDMQDASAAAPAASTAAAAASGSPSAAAASTSASLFPPSSAAPSPVPLGVLAEELGSGVPPPLLADGSVDDDALIAAALAEEEEQEQGDVEEEEEEGAAADPFAAAAAAVAKASAPPAVGETYISETGEVLRRRAPRKKKIVEASSAVDQAQLEADQKAASERAERLMADLLQRTNEVMMRTQEGTAATPSAPGNKKKRRDDGPRRKSEKEEDAELLNDLQQDTLPNGAVQLRQQPTCVTGTMRAYQLEGLNWMIRLYHSGVSGILADEMGLGKTLQAISLLGYLREFQNVPGPHLVLVPLSTLGNWHREFNRWCPAIRCFRFHGTKEERADMIAQGQLQPDQWDVLLTSYEMSIREKSSLNKIAFQFIVVDEAHRLKNEGSLLSQIVRIFSSKNRLLLTGTPLQNNLHELWALLNFLLPEIFASAQDFDMMFSAAQTDPNVSNNLLTQLHKVLRPFMLRRLKVQVATDLPPKKETLLFVGMSEMQARLYRGILEKDLEAVLGKTNQKSRLMNMVMQLRKAANHPYLFEGVEDRSLPPYGDHLITTSGKMSVMDKLLKRFKAQDSRVLIFSQMTRTLDIMEDYCIYRGWKYSRIDGNTSQEDRETSMREFNAEGSEKFVFLLSTRAGGLGINLNTADIVILFDSDWNPQMDLQAMDRAHRIGQKKKVFVYRLITENTIEQKIVEAAEIKLRLDRLAIQSHNAQPVGGAAAGGSGGGGGGAAGKSGSGAMSAEEMSKMIRFGADRIFRQQGSSITDEDIDVILQQAEARTQEMQSKLGKHVGLLDLTLDGAPPLLISEEAEGDLTAAEELERQLLLTLHEGSALGNRRDRKGTTKSYNENQVFREAMKAGVEAAGAGAVAEKKSHLPKPYKVPRMPDYQLWSSARIQELSEQEKAWYDEHAFDTSVESIRGGLTPAEDAELQRLLSEGFSDWTWADYIAFLDACKRYGGRDLERVISALQEVRPNLTRDQISRYHAAFFARAPGTPGFKSALTAIARGEARVKKFAEFEELLERAMEAYPQRQDVMDRLNIPYAPLHKGKGFTLGEDRFLLYCTRTIGYGEWPKLRSAVRRDAEFRFDYFLKSRSVSQLARRVDVLLRAMKKSSIKAAGKREAAAAQAQAQAAAAVAAQEAGGGGASGPLGAPASGSGKVRRDAHTPGPGQSSRVSDAPRSAARPGSALGMGGRPTPSPVHFSARLQGGLTPSVSVNASGARPTDDLPLSLKRQALRVGDSPLLPLDDDVRGGPSGGAPLSASASAVAHALLGGDTLALIDHLPSAEEDMTLAQRRRIITTAQRRHADGQVTLQQQEQQRVPAAPAQPTFRASDAVHDSGARMADVSTAHRVGISAPSASASASSPLAPGPHPDDDESEEDDEDGDGDGDEEEEDEQAHADKKQRVQ